MTTRMRRRKKGKNSRNRGGHPVHTVYSMNSKVAWGRELGTETGEEGEEEGKRTLAMRLLARLRLGPKDLA